MDNYLIDTDTCIFLLKGKYGVKEKVKEIGIDNCFVSEVTLLELSFGAFKSSKPSQHLKELDTVEKLFGVLPIYDCIELFGKEKARLSRLGKLIPDFDLLIGVTAIKNRMILVTGNEKHLSRVEGVKIENWIDRNKK